MSDGYVRVFSGDWGIEYLPGARLADIRYLGHVVDCVQVRDWDFRYGPTDQPSRVPGHTDIMNAFVEWLGEHRSEYVR